MLVCLSLTACAQLPQSTGVAMSSDTADAAPVAYRPVLPNVELTEELLYTYLLSEIAFQRGQMPLAVQGSMDLADQTRDPRLAARATKMAIDAGDIERAMQAFELWQEIEPDTPERSRSAALLLLRAGKFDEAQAEFSKVLKESSDTGLVFLHVYRFIETHPDKKAALTLVSNLAGQYPALPEAHWSVAHMANLNGNTELALEEVRRARNLRADWAMAVSLEAQILAGKSPDQALTVMSEFLSRYPESREIRLQYARALLAQQQYQAARDEFQRLADKHPDGPDMSYTIALISLQLNDLDRAEEMLNKALSKGGAMQDTVRYYLGQMYEAKQDQVAALSNYREVKSGEYLFAAQLRTAYLLGQSGRREEAHRYLRKIVPEDNQQRARLSTAEAQMLREEGKEAEAYALLQDALQQLPNHPDLLYAAAMQADRLGKLEEFEQPLRKLIELIPDSAHAYNALGYGLLERNVRIPEAVELVEKALQLAPDDFAIMDSVGWAYYRDGRLAESLVLLRRAFAASPDPEIAAHLGEVLWVSGGKDEAQAIWQDSLKKNPDNSYLQTVIKKFIP